MSVYSLMSSTAFKVHKYIIEDMFNKRKQRESHGKEGALSWPDRNISRLKINGMHRAASGGELYRTSLGCLNKDSKNNS